MQHDLYFIPILDRAYQQLDLRAALEAAFEEILQLGRRPEYRRGLRQFHAFLQAATEAAASGYVDPAFGAPEATPAHPAVPLVAVPPPFGIVIDGGVGLAISIDLPAAGAVARVSDIHPGRYRIRTNSDRLLWQGRLSARQLVWRRAHPRRPILLAAAVAPPAQRPTLRLSLLRGEFRVSVFAGAEAGFIEVQRGSGSRG